MYLISFVGIVSVYFIYSFMLNLGPNSVLKLEIITHSLVNQTKHTAILRACEYVRSTAPPSGSVANQSNQVIYINHVVPVTCSVHGPSLLI